MVDISFLINSNIRYKVLHLILKINVEENLR